MHTTILDALADHGVQLRRPHIGENRGPCPKCDRAKHDDALAVRIEDESAVFVCHRCQWSGVAWTIMLTSLRSRTLRKSVNCSGALPSLVNVLATAAE